MAGMIIQIATQHAWYQIAIGRLIEGLGVGSLSVLTPMYETESAPTHIREVIVRYDPQVSRQQLNRCADCYITVHIN